MPENSTTRSITDLFQPEVIQYCPWPFDEQVVWSIVPHPPCGSLHFKLLPLTGAWRCANCNPFIPGQAKPPEQPLQRTTRAALNAAIRRGEENYERRKRERADDD